MEDINIQEFDMKRISLLERIRNENFIIVDIEAIKISEDHACIRKIYILSKNGMKNLEVECTPCKWLCELPKKYKEAFFYCQRHIHKLNYYPPRYCTVKCNDVPNIVRNFDRNVKLMLYKGGEYEKKLARSIGMDSINIEEVGIQKVNSHNPKEEVNLYFNQLLHLKA